MKLPNFSTQHLLFFLTMTFAVAWYFSPSSDLKEIVIACLSAFLTATQIRNDNNTQTKE